jgi:hypothetical protein
MAEARRTHLYTPLSLGLLWTSDRPVAEISTWQHSQQTDIHDPGGIITYNPSKRAAADQGLIYYNRKFINYTPPPMECFLPSFYLEHSSTWLPFFGTVRKISHHLSTKFDQWINVIALLYSNTALSSMPKFTALCMGSWKKTHWKANMNNWGPL